MSSSPLFFALQGSQDYAGKVAVRLGCVVAAHEERTFEDGEHKCRPLEPVNGRDTIVIHSLYGDDGQTANDKLCRLLFFCGALKDAGARRVHVVAPYLCYARKDRRTQPQDPISTRYVAAMFESCGVDRLLTVEVHNVAAFDNAFRIPTQHLATADLFADYFARLDQGMELVAVSPDAGGAKRVERFRRAMEERLKRPVGSAYMEKHRSGGVVKGALLAGDVRRKIAIVFDDLISTGGTLLRAGQACRDQGAERVFAAAAHGLFTGGVELLNSPLFEHIVICDSVPPFRVDPELVARRLEILDTSEAAASLLSEEYGPNR